MISEKNNGKFLEYLIQLIEKSISPNSIVEHDVKLPIINSRIGAKTQCDIVIKTGKKPRETITIIEVQDRTSRVKPNDFRGWKQKLEDVGAQHLICVSRNEFPKSIREQASLSGNSIRLVTLKELKADQIPLDFFNIDFTYTNFDITKIDNMHVSISRSELKEMGIKDDVLNKNEIEINERSFSIDKVEIISLFLLCKKYFSPPKDKKHGIDKLVFDIKKDPPLYFYIHGQFIRIGIEFLFTWTNEIISIPISILSYEQNDFGTLAWVIESSYSSPRGQIWFKTPVTKVGQYYRIKNTLVSLPPNVELTLSIR